MSAKLEMLSQNLQTHFGDKLKSLNFALGEITIEVAAADYLSVMAALRNEPDLQFEELVDLCGVDYSTYGEGAWQGRRFAGRCLRNSVGSENVLEPADHDFLRPAK